MSGRLVHYNLIQRNGWLLPVDPDENGRLIARPGAVLPDVGWESVAAQLEQQSEAP